MLYSDTQEKAEVEQLYRQHHGWLVGWLRRKTQGADASLDLAQETFIRLLKNPRLTAEIENPKSWLARAAGNLAIDRVRREILERNYLTLLATMPEEVQPSPEQKWQVLNALEAIQAVLEGLRPVEMSAFLLIRIEGLSYREAAEFLGVSLSSVEKYVVKATLICYRASYDYG